MEEFAYAISDKDCQELSDAIDKLPFVPAAPYRLLRPLRKRLGLPASPPGIRFNAQALFAQVVARGIAAEEVNAPKNGGAND